MENTLKRWSNRQASLLLAALGAAGNLLAQENDAHELKRILRQADGRVARLEADRTYLLNEKIQLDALCPHGIELDGNNATLKAVPNFRHNVLLTSTRLLRDAPYAAGTTIRDLTIDGNKSVGRCIFGNWKRVTLDNIVVRGGTIYQVNAVWHDAVLCNLTIQGNAAQRDNGFDCHLEDSTVCNIDVDMNGNLNTSAFWLNGCRHVNVINAHLRDGRTAFGLENCWDVNVINMRVDGRYSFRVVNILPANSSKRIHFYNVDLQPKHVGTDASAGFHFNATEGGLVARGRIRSSGPAVLLTHNASDIDVIHVDLSDGALQPTTGWVSTRPNVWSSRRRYRSRLTEGVPPVVWAGPDRSVERTNHITLRGVVADDGTSGNLRVRWHKSSGPGRVRLSHSKHPTTKIRFSRPGTYTMKLLATDGSFTSEDEVRLIVR